MSESSEHTPSSTGHSNPADPSIDGDRSPAQVTSNESPTVTAVVRHFATDGLIETDYLAAAAKWPVLKTQKPETLIHNVEGVAKHFAADGLATSAYLRSALLKPQLFYQKPDTIIGHIHLIESLQKQNLLTIDQGRPALFAFVLKNPRYLTLADDNIHLREIVGHATGSSAALREPRKSVESAFAKRLGQENLNVPTPQISRPNDPGEDMGPHARNVLLRALIREGYIKGKLR